MVNDFPWGKTLSLVPKSRSSIKVRVKYQGRSFRKNGRCGGIRRKSGRCGGIQVSQTHLVKGC